MMFTDEELAIKAQNGDVISEEILIDRYKPLVKSKSKLYYIIGSDKEDVIQEAMIGLFKAIRSFDTDKSSFITYSTKCITGQLINAIKKANRFKHSPLNNSLSLDADTESEQSVCVDERNVLISENTPESLLLEKELIEYLSVEDNEFFSKFESRVWALMFDGNSYTEIAKQLGKSEKSIDNAVQRIKRKIYNFLTE